MDTRFFEDIPFLQSLEEKDLRVIMNFVERKVYKKGDVIITQGEKGDGMYVIMFGDVGVNKNGNNVATLHNNDFFGEVSLITNEPRGATITALTDKVSVLFLSRMSFDRIKEKLDPSIREEILRRIQENFVTV